MPCQAHLGEVAKVQSELESLGVGIVGVSMSPAHGLGLYLTGKSWNFPILADPERKAYAAFGLGRTTWGRILRLSVIAKYMKQIWNGGKVRRVLDGEDALQLGGDFLVGTDRRILWAHRGEDPTDRPTVQEILRIVRQIVDKPAPPTY